MDLSFEICTIEDLEILTQISRSTFVSAFEKDNNPEDFWTYIDTAFSEKSVLQQLLNTDTTFYFVYLKNVLVGYIKLNESNAQNEQFTKPSVELERIYVIDSFQGEGIGKHMLQKVIEITSTKHVSFLWLGVWEQNTDAIRFYKRFGFKKFDSHPYYIGNDKQIDWLMKLELN